jgi:hypothetical protein
MAFNVSMLYIRKQLECGGGGGKARASPTEACAHCVTLCGGLSAQTNQSLRQHRDPNSHHFKLNLFPTSPSFQLSRLGNPRATSVCTPQSESTDHDRVRNGHWNQPGRASVLLLLLRRHGP